MLANAGLCCLVQPTPIAEHEVKGRMRKQGADASAVAVALAEAKARCAAERNPAAYVIGADQMLVLGDRWHDKPTDRASARAQLLSLRGEVHELITSAVVVRGPMLLWRYTGRARLVMRPFSEAFLESYLDAVGAAATSSVGAYQLEGRGAQLFEKIQGDFFTILGLPLLPLLDFLRREGVLET
jgi:septum formation protein